MSTPGEVRAAVCVLGMHRSGTSLLMRLAELLGVHLGRPGDLAEAAHDNPRGYWEHGGILNLNNRILERFGGHWDTPPALPPGWHESPGLEDLRSEARGVLEASFPDTGLWGFKDPRLCLTLPFWLPLIGPARVLLIVRHPLEVAASLARRDRMPAGRSLGLWQTYVEASLSHSAHASRLFVFYEDLVESPLDELARVAAWLGLDVPRPGDRIDQAVRTFVSPTLRHHQARDHSGLDEGATRGLAAAEAVYRTLSLVVRPMRLTGEAATVGGGPRTVRGSARPTAMRTVADDTDAPAARIELRHVKRRLAELRARVAAAEAVHSIVASIPGRILFALARAGASVLSPGSRGVRSLAWAARAAGILRDDGARALVRHAVRRARPATAAPGRQPGAAVAAPGWPLTYTTARRKGARRAAQRGKALESLDGPGTAFLLVTGSLAGGTARHVEDLSRLLEAEGTRALVLEAVGADFLRLRRPAVSPGREHVFDGRAEQVFLLEALRRVGVAHVHVHHLSGWPAALPVNNLAEDLRVAYDYTIHDYHPVCPRLHLQQPDGRYCGEPDTDGCNRCLTRHGDLTGRPVKTAIGPWRAAHGRLLRGARRVFAPTEDVRQRILRYFPDLAVLVRPHADPHPAARVVAARPDAHEPLRVGVIGHLSVLKGAAMLADCARDARTRGLPLRFHLIGSAARPARRLARQGIVLGGPYREDEIFERLAAYALHCAFFPSRIPETYSYSLSIAQLAGLFPVAFAIGALAERIARAGWGELLPLSASPAQVNERFVALRPCLAGSPPPSPPAAVRYASVLQDYYGWPHDEAPAPR